MNQYSSTSYARQPPPASSSRRPVAQPTPSYPGSASFLPPPPATPMHPPLPLHYRAPTAGRSYTPVTLPPLQSGYTTDNGRRERSVRLPGFSEVAGQQSRESESSRNRYREREREREREVCSVRHFRPRMRIHCISVKSKSWGVYVGQSSLFL